MVPTLDTSEVREWKRYEDVTECGNNWFPAVPRDWKLLRLKYLSSEPLQYGANESGGDQDSDDPRFVRITDVDSHGNLRDETRCTLKRALAIPYLLNRGDILFARSGATVGKTFLYRESWGEACYAGYLIRFRPDLNRVVPSFVDYFTATKQYLGWVSEQQSQATIQNISAEKYANLWVPVPPLPEQRAIAAFLDRETARIGALIGHKQRLIDLLEEKRQAVVSHAVTQGLDPNVEMKDSGLPFVEGVPEHWVTRPLSFVLEYISYGFTNPMPSTSSGPYMLTANDIGDGQIKYDSARSTTQEAFDDLLTDKCRPRKDDLLITKDGTLGRTAICDGTVCCINQSVALLRFKTSSVSLSFIHDVLRSLPYQEQIRFDAGGTTIKHIYITRLAKMSVAFPPIAEQIAITEYCERKRTEVQQAISKVRESIRTLQEYRTALISAAVTGQIDVRDEVQLDG